MLHRQAPINKTGRWDSHWMWISMFWSTWGPHSLNKAIIYMILYSTSFPTGAFFFFFTPSSNSTVNSHSVRILFSISVAAAVITRGTLMKQSSFPPDRERAPAPITVQLYRQGWHLLPLFSLSILSQMTPFVFFNQAFYCSSVQWTLQLLTRRFIQWRG